MLSQALKQEIQDAYSSLLSNKSLKPRRGQKEMIACIAKTLSAIERDGDDHRINDAGICAIEAGTGTGKTVAYTLAVLPIAKALGKKVVISTATVALQEQIIYRDLPDIAKHSGLRFRFALAKGRGRYLCLSKLDQLMNVSSQDDIFATDSNAAPAPEENQIDGVLYESMAKAMLTGEWDGDKDNWPGDLTPEQWQPLTSDSNQCTNRRCQHVAQCSFIKSRDYLSSVDCIVANHDLVMADLALGGGAILSNPEDTIYVFDEAHHLSDVALRHFAGQLRIHGAMSWVDQSIKSITETARNHSSFIRLLNRLDSLPHLLLELKQFYEQVKPLLEEHCSDLLPDLSNAYQMPHKRFENGEIPNELQILSATCATLTAKVVDEMMAAHDMVNEALEDNDSGLSVGQLEVIYVSLGQMLSTAQRHLGVWQAYTKDVEDVPDSRWIQLVEAGGFLDFELCCSPLLASQALNQYLWHRCYGAILTSATLTALGEFHRLRMHTGLPSFAQTSVVLSPFNYSENAQFVVPKMQSEATDHLRHSDEIAAMLPNLLKDDQASLVLFSSRKQMNDVFELLDSRWQSFVLKQSDMSKQKLIEQHIQRVDDGGERSILFGLASFSEGIDLPGKYCTHVIIAKLPFSVPNNPVDAALAEWFEQQGKNPFMEISLPDASQRLIQACGRLIRTETDRGTITLLDKRIMTKRYGIRLLNTLPPFQKILEAS